MAQGIARRNYSLKPPHTSLVNWFRALMVDGPGWYGTLNEYCANKQQRLKPPQETSCLFRSETENKLPNKQTK